MFTSLKGYKLLFVNFIRHFITKNLSSFKGILPDLPILSIFYWIELNGLNIKH